jgi:type I restriction enzyme M protein
LCHYLRHDGIDYGDYLDQLTSLLFVKMADEQGIALACGWRDLVASDNSHLLGTYDEALRSLCATPGFVGEIFGGLTSAFSRPESLRRVLDEISAIKWSEHAGDVQGDAYEYVLEQAAAEGKKGAGQYFTPRALMRTVV